MKLFNCYKPLWKRPILAISLALTIPFVVTACDRETTRTEYVGYIENFRCQASASCELNDGKQEEVAIAPYLPLQAGYEIKVLKEGFWIEVKLKTGDLIKVTKDYTVPTNKEPFSPGFFKQIKGLLDYFEELHQDNTRNSSQTKNKNKAKETETVSRETELSPETNNTPNPEKTLEEIITCKTGLSDKAKLTLEEIINGEIGLSDKTKLTLEWIINNEIGLSDKARRTLLAGLSTMQKEDGWTQKASYLLKGIEEDYYPASLVRKELNR